LRKVNAGARLSAWNSLALRSIAIATETNARSGLPGIGPADYARRYPAQFAEQHGLKLLARGTRHVVNRAATAPRMGASTLLRSQTYLGAPKAITAMAHRLARLVYRMLKYGQQYVDKGAEYYEQRNRQQQIEFVRKKAAQLGLQVTPALA